MVSKIIYLLAILLVPFAFANDYAYIDQNATVWCSITDNGIPKSVDYATFYIYDIQTNLIHTNNGTLEKTGVYYDYYTFNESGNYLHNCDFYKNDTLVGTAYQSITVFDEGVFNTEMFTLLVIFGIGILLLITGQFIGNYLFNIAGGVWFVINSFYSLNAIPSLGMYGFIFFMLIGMSAILQSSLLMLKTNEKRNVDD